MRVNLVLVAGRSETSRVKIIIRHSQFDNAAHVPHLSKAEILKYVESEADAMLKRPAPLIELARQNGEAWVAAASKENIMRLPERARLALLLTQWAGLTSEEAGEIMGIEPHSVENNTFYAKRKLEYILSVLKGQCSMDWKEVWR